jgi:hypothetical protein
MKHQIQNKNVEESVDDLIKRLEGQGKKVKIIQEGEEEEGGNESDEKETSPDIHRQSTFME